MKGKLSPCRVEPGERGQDPYIRPSSCRRLGDATGTNARQPFHLDPAFLADSRQATAPEDLSRVMADRPSRESGECEREAINAHHRERHRTRGREAYCPGELSGLPSLPFSEQHPTFLKTIYDRATGESEVVPYRRATPDTFASLPNGPLFDASISASQWVILSILTDQRDRYTFHRHGRIESTLSQGFIAHHVGERALWPSAVSQQIARMEENGWLTSTQRGGRKTNRYVVHLADDVLHLDQDGRKTTVWNRDVGRRETLTKRRFTPGRFYTFPRAILYSTSFSPQEKRILAILGARRNLFKWYGEGAVETRASRETLAVGITTNYVSALTKRLARKGVLRTRRRGCGLVNLYYLARYENGAWTFPVGSPQSGRARIKRRLGRDEVNHEAVRNQHFKRRRKKRWARDRDAAQRAADEAADRADSERERAEMQRRAEARSKAEAARSGGDSLFGSALEGLIGRERPPNGGADPERGPP